MPDTSGKPLQTEPHTSDGLPTQRAAQDTDYRDLKEQFTQVLSNLTLGICMFDGAQRLVVWNDHYASMYGLPPDVLKRGMSLDEVVGLRIAKRIFAGSSPEDYVRDRRDWADNHGRLEQVHYLSDGRIIEVRRRLMADGGWLSTHADITRHLKVEEALRETEQLFSKAFHACSIPTAITDPETGTYHDVNAAWIGTFGYRREQVIGRSSVELGVWANPADRDRYVARVTGEGSISGYETIFRTKDGDDLICLTSGEIVESGGQVRMLSISLDVTARTKAERALRDSEQKYRMLVESTHVIPWEFDAADARFTYIAPQVVEQFGYPLSDWYRDGFWSEVIHPEDREEAVAYCEAATARGEDHEFEYRMLKADGEVAWVRDIVSVHKGGDGPPTLRGVFIDITERYEAESRLRDSEQRFRDFAETASDWFWETDEDHRFVFISDRSSEVLEVEAERFMGLTRHELGRAIDPDADWAGHTADLEAHRPFRDFRYTLVTSGGQRCHVSVSGKPVFDADGTFSGYRGTCSDRTRAVKAELEIVRHRDRLAEQVDAATADLKAKAAEMARALAREKEVNEQQRQFLSTASHEFRTPLAVIDGPVQRLMRRRDQMTADYLDERLRKIRNAVATMTALMESTLSAAQTDAGTMKIDIKDCDLRRAIDDVCARQHEVSDAHRITRDLRRLPDRIAADANALNQIFTNLISNAVKYARGKPEIAIKGWTEGMDSVVAVSDKGVGIDQEEIPKMFTRFFRASTSTGIPGTGIGLSLVKTLVELHGGAISVASRKGHGSTFTVRLPIAQRSAKQELDGRAA